MKEGLLRTSMYFKPLRKNGLKWFMERLCFSTGTKKFLLCLSKNFRKASLRITKNLKPYYFNEKYFIKDRNGNVIKKSENLNRLINKTSWNKLRLV